MARITIEDCVDKVSNRFELVLVAAHRARILAKGGAPVVQRDDDKNPVVALREIAGKAVLPNDLREELLQSLQARVDVDEPDLVAAPLLNPTQVPSVRERDAQAADDVVDEVTMSEEQLFRALQSSIPTASDIDSSRSR